MEETATSCVFVWIFQFQPAKVRGSKSDLLSVCLKFTVLYILFCMKFSLPVSFYTKKAISVWILLHRLTVQPNINCVNCSKSFVFRQRFIKYQNGLKVKSSQKMDLFWSFSLKTRMVVRMESPKKISTGQSFICKGKSLKHFIVSKKIIYLFHFFICTE